MRHLPPSKLSKLIGFAAFAMLITVLILSARADWLPNPQAGAFNFSDVQVPLYEGESSVRLTITRDGGSLGASSVYYYTVNGSALAGQDYTAKQGWLFWQDGDSSSRQIDIPVMNDDLNEPDERFVVQLAYPQNQSSLGSRSACTVNIVTRDNPRPPSHLIGRAFGTDLLPSLALEGVYSRLIGAGDVNADGQDDIAAGAMYWEQFPSLDTNGNETDGYSCPQGLLRLLTDLPISGNIVNTTSPIYERLSREGTTAFGSYVAPLGDINGDGFFDVAVGSQNYFAPASEALVVLGKARSQNNYTSFTLELPDVGESHNSSSVWFSYLGDINNDGYSDFCLYSYFPDQDGDYGTSACLVYGRAFFEDFELFDGQGSTQNVNLLDDYIASIGDFNGDGYTDYIASNATGKYLLYGSSSGLSLSGQAYAQTLNANTKIDGDLSPVGDINGDGCCDLATILTSSHANTSMTIGLLFGRRDPAPVIAVGNELDGVKGVRAVLPYWGGELTGIGDFNGDGFCDIAVKDAYSFGDEAPSTTPLLIMYGAAHGVGPTCELNETHSITMPQADGINLSALTALPWLLGDVAAGGDINRDGASDLLIGGTPYLGGAEYPCYVADGNLSATLVFGKASSTISTYKAYFPAGTTVRRGVGLLANGTHSTPFSRCWAKYMGGGESQLSVTVHKTTESVSNYPASALPYVWEVFSDRINHTAAEFTFAYDPNLPSRDENRVSVLFSDSPSGPWQVAAVVNRDPFKSRITARVYPEDGPHLYFLIKLPQSSSGSLGDEGSENEIRRKPSVAFTAPANGMVRSSSLPITLKLAYDGGDSQLLYEDTTITLNGVTAPGTLNVSGSTGTLELGTLPPAAYTATVFVYAANDEKASATIHFRVEPTPDPHYASPEVRWNSAFISTTVYDAVTRQPLDGASVGLRVPQQGVMEAVQSGSDGKFFLPVNQTGNYIVDILKKDHVTAQRPVNVTQLGETFSVNPVFLQPIVPEQNREIIDGKIGGSATITSGGQPLITINIPAGATQTTMPVSAAWYEHQEDLPGPLPISTAFTHAVELLPDGQTFDTTVTVAIINTRGFAPGTTIPVGMYNYNTAEWQHETVAVVSDDGTSVTWGVQHFSPWDINASQRFLTYIKDKQIRQEGDQSKPCSDQIGVASHSIVKLGRGRVYVDVPLSENAAGAMGPPVTLRYSSHTANPTYLAEHEIQRPQNSAAIGSKFTLQAQGRTLEGYFSEAPTTTAARMRMLYDCRDNNGITLSTGKHTLVQKATNVTTREFFTSERFGAAAVDPIPSDYAGEEMVGGGTPQNVDFMVHNQQKSPFGAGWGMLGLQTVALSKDELGAINLQIADGDGSMSSFDACNDKYDLIFSDSTAGAVFTKGGEETIILDNLPSHVNRSDLLVRSREGTWQRESLDLVYVNPRNGFDCSGDGRYVVLLGTSRETSEFAGQSGIFYYDRATQNLNLIDADLYSNESGYQALLRDPKFGTNTNFLFYLKTKYAEQEKTLLCRYDLVTKDLVEYDITTSEHHYVSLQQVSSQGDKVLIRKDADGSDAFEIVIFDVNDSVEIPVWSSSNGSYYLSRRVSMSADSNTICFNDTEEETGCFVIRIVDLKSSTSKVVGAPERRPGMFYRYNCGNPVLSLNGNVLLFDSNSPSLTYGESQGISDDVLCLYRIDSGEVRQLGVHDLLRADVSPREDFFIYRTRYSAYHVFDLMSTPFSIERYRGVGPDVGSILDLGDRYMWLRPDNSFYMFDNNWLQIAYGNRGQNQTAYKWGKVAGCDRLMEIRYPGGSVVSFEYTAEAMLAAQVDSDGKRTSFETDSSGNLVKVARPDGQIQRFSYDDRHLMTSKSEPGGFRTDYHWDFLGFINSIDAPIRSEARVSTTGAVTVTKNRERWTYRIQDAVGTILPKEQSAAGPGAILAHRAPLVFDPELYLEERLNGRVIQQGEMTDFKYPAATKVGNSGIVSEKYSSNRLLLEKTTALGNKIIAQYNGQGQLTQLTDQVSSSVLKIAWDTFSFGLPLVKSISDSWTTQTSFAYEVASSFDDFKRIVKVTATDAAGHNAISTYDPVVSGSDIWALSSQKDWNEQLTQFIYNPNGSLRQLVADGISRLSMQYDSRGNVTRIMTSEHSSTPISTVSMQYDGNSRLSKLVDSDTERVTKYGYDDMGHVNYLELPLGRITRMKYGPKDLLSEVVTPDGNGMRLYYNDMRLLALAERADGARTTYLHDNSGRVTKIFDPLSHATSIGYNAADQPTTVTDATGRVSVSEYDNAGRLTASLDSLGFGTHYSYNVNNQVTSVTDALDYVTSYDYDYTDDKRGLLRAIDYPDATSAEMTYDANRNLERQQDRLGNVTSYDYDGADRLTTVTDARLGVTEFIYDALDRLRTQILPDGTSITTELNASNEIASQAYPSGNKVEYARDGAGRLTGTAASDNHTSWTYDVMDRLTAASNEAAVLGWTYEPATGVLTSSTQQNLNQPPLSGQSEPPVYTTLRAYDATHTRLEQVTYPSGATVAYDYDDADRVTSLSHSGTGTYAFTYDERGLPETMTTPNGLMTRYWRDKAGKVVAQKTVRQSNSAVVLQQEFGYNSVGDKTFKTTSWDNASAEVTRSDLYQLDNGSQVVGVRYGVPASRMDVGQISYADQPQPPPGGYDGATSWALEEAWKFDALGNREWMTVRTGGGATSVTTRYTADIMNRYSAITGKTPQHDTDGRITRFNGYKLLWTIEGRLKEVRYASNNDLVFSYEYDPLGRRISRTDMVGSSTWYIWDGSHVIEERDDAGNILAEYLWGPGHEQLLATRKTMYQPTWGITVLGDLNSVAAITGSAGQVIERFQYSIYGQPSRIDVNTGEDLGAIYSSDYTNHLYNGQYWEENLALNMYRERWMSPALGRFISPSALTYPVAELNYLFCFNNPVTFVDFYGLLATAAAMADSYDQFIDNSVVGTGSTGSFLGDFVKYSFAEALKLPADVARLGQGAAIAYEGNDFAGNCLSGWERGLYGASDVGRVTALAGGVGGAAKGVGAGIKGLKGLKDAKDAASVANEIGILRAATRGKGNFGVGSANAADAVRLGESWVGHSAKVASDGKTLISADGLRQFRPPSFKPNLNRIQANFEQRWAPEGAWQSNGHLDILP